MRAGGDRRRLGRSLALPKWLNPDHARYNPTVLGLSARKPGTRTRPTGVGAANVLGPLRAGSQSPFS